MIGPTVEAVESDRVRIFVTDRLPEPMTVHWHGVVLTSGTDRVQGPGHPGIPPGKTFACEVDLATVRTFPYHPHADKMVQMAWAKWACSSSTPRIRPSAASTATA